MTLTLNCRTSMGGRSEITGGVALSCDDGGEDTGAGSSPRALRLTGAIKKISTAVVLTTELKLDLMRNHARSSTRICPSSQFSLAGRQIERAVFGDLGSFCRLDRLCGPRDPIQCPAQIR